ncbi:tRNA 2-selenouridine(34) synthase MnmH [uncultured Desulfovibrio sp.]|uniref:tRNA 2-selenouridine(34) synthase MnmH n=1 Tax=uncultured Desulfovibrio sp. TaxID=167968 RepID=UPI00261A5EA4|nr:tRNA 2-selenouridine(34) synthase MnmH [uncultured Desulfovibrio sp.]
MPVLHPIEDFLRLRDAGLPLLDVRSPAEFQTAHIAGARNLPLFSDEERARVGTAYARQGQEAATLLALRLVGGRLADMVETARQLCPPQPLTADAAAVLAASPSARCAASSPVPDHAFPPLPEAPSLPGRHVLLHCWRGGLRSRSVGWLLESCGFTVHLLRGGYRAFRAHVRKELARPRPVLILGGMTGCGKTDILHALADRGEQIIDLEGLANHRGSAFGAVALSGGQPGNEAFENDLFEQWRTLDPRRPVWLEDESRRIGHVTLCEEFFRHIDTSPLLVVDLPQPLRIRRLVSIYGGTSPDSPPEPAVAEALCAALQKLRRRLGSEACTRCCELVRAGRLDEAAGRVLHYYDKCYAHQQAQRSGRLLGRLTCEEDAPQETARRLTLLVAEVAASDAGRPSSPVSPNLR